jgi:hypothetical protein
MSKKKLESSLLKALSFIALAQKDKGAPYQTHVMLQNNTAIAFDGILAAGHIIDEDLQACPHTLTLVSALKKAPGALSITKPNQGQLCIRAGKFMANVPCMPDAVLPGIYPDPPVGMLDNRLRTGLTLLSPFITENSLRVIMASAMVRSGTMIATNGVVLVEYWHGIDLPPKLLLPKVFINALSKITKNLTQFGFSDTSFTVYFEDNSWLKTQLYTEKWPDIDSIMAKPHRPHDIPKDFFEGINTIADFAQEGRIYLRNGIVKTHEQDNIGANYAVSDLVANITLNLKHLTLLEELIKTIDFVGHNGVSYFYGENIRGALAQIKD